MRLHERDDIGSLPIPSIGKRYARMTSADLAPSSPGGMSKKQSMWYKLGNQLFNKGRTVGKFDSKDAVGTVQHSMHGASVHTPSMPEGGRRKMAEAIVDRLLSRD